jgi:hypothetical protein
MSGCAHMNRDELCAACALPKGREWKAKSLAAERHCAALEAELVDLRAERDALRQRCLNLGGAHTLGTALIKAREVRAIKAEAALREIERIMSPFDGSTAIPYQQVLDIACAALRDTAPAPTINTTTRDYRTDYKFADGTPIQHTATNTAPAEEPDKICTHGGLLGNYPDCCMPAPACPHGNPPGSARDCACHEEEPHGQ